MWEKTVSGIRERNYVGIKRVFVLACCLCVDLQMRCVSSRLRPWLHVCGGGGLGRACAEKVQLGRCREGTMVVWVWGCVGVGVHDMVMGRGWLVALLGSKGVVTV